MEERDDRRFDLDVLHSIVGAMTNGMEYNTTLYRSMFENSKLPAYSVHGGVEISQEMAERISDGIQNGVVTLIPEPNSQLGSVVENMLKLSPSLAREYEADEKLIGLVAAYRDNQEFKQRLGIISDRLEDLGFPEADIRMVLMRQYPMLWDMSWWPTCIRKDGE